METHSMALLRQLQASSNKGFLFLLSKSSGSSSLKANKSKAIQQDDAMLAMHTIELNPLALADVAHIANEIFDVQLASIAGIANRQLPFGIVEKIFVASSGIPLYVTEITKAFSKTYDTLTEHFLATYSSIQEPEEGEEGEEGRLAQTQLTEEMSQSVLSILQHLNIGRIEEAICFRVDQLSVPCQMLLKIIATANANESAASLDMLVSIIMATAGFGLEAFTAILEEAEEEYDAPQHPQSPNDAENHHNQRIKDKLMETIMNFVDEVLQMDDFLEEVQSTAGFVLEAKATGDDNSIDCNRFRYFRFHVELERLTIYKMMLEEQRSFLHDKIATYLEEERKACMESSKQDPTKLLSVELWAEEGFHWAAGHVWSAALQCFDESATLHCQQHPTDYEQSIIFFQQAVSMWISLQQEYAINSAVASLISASSPAKMDNSTRTPTASATSLPPSASAVTIFQPYSNQYAAAAFLTSPRISAVTKSTTSSTSSTTTSTSSSVDSSTSSRDASIQSVEGLNSTFTRQILFQIFAGDIELFDQTLRMLVKFLITCIQYQRSLHPPHHVSSILSNEDDIFIWINHILKEIATMIKGMFVNESLMLKTTTATVTTMLNKSSSSSKLSSKTNKSIKSRRSSRHHSFMQAAIEDFSIQQISSCIPVLQEIIRLFEVQDLSVSCEIPSAVFQELLQQVSGSE